MHLLFPHASFAGVTEIPADFFTSRGIRALILDIDNTLTTHDNPAPGNGVLSWLAAMQGAGLRAVLLSNNKPERVRPFGEMLGLEFEANARKPLPGGIRRACTHMGVTQKETALIGDQIFTDVLAGRLGGVYTVLLNPIEPEKTRFFRFKRRLEQPIRKQLQGRKPIK